MTGHKTADCQCVAKGADTFPENNLFALCLEGYTAESQTQKEQKPWRDHSLKHTGVMEGSSPVDWHTIDSCQWEPIPMAGSPLQPPTAGCLSCRYLLSHLWPSDLAWLVFIFSCDKKQALLWTHCWWDCCGEARLRPALYNIKYSSRRTGILSNRSFIFFIKSLLCQILSMSLTEARQNSTIWAEWTLPNAL